METLSTDAQIDRDTLARAIHVRNIIDSIGEDSDRQGLLQTPLRVAKAWNELTVGYKMDPAKILSTQFEIENYEQMILLRDIEFFSVCEHHMLPFFGRAHVAYIPGSKRVVGLSKLARLVECYAKRLQIQERMTSQIGSTILELLKPAGVGVIVQAQHTCMLARGISKQKAEMVTSYLAGSFQEGSVRSEFLAICQR
jgi:GTP cyclohydrolase I